MWRGSILVITALAFYLRLRSLTLFQFHIDEFFTLPAADLIAKSGVPLYPTGLFYDPGLPFSYIDGALFRLLGFSEALGRWPAVIFGTLAVVTVYWLGTQALRSPAVGVLAALWLTLSLESVEWGGRARMITLAQWLALLSVVLLWLGLTRASVRHRLWFALSYGGTLLTHFSTVVLMPAWFVAAAALWWAKALRFQRALLRDTLLLLLTFGLVISSGVIFQPPPTVEFQTTNSGLDTKMGLLTNKFLQIPSDVGHAWESYGSYFIDWPHGPVLVLGIIGLVISLTRLVFASRGTVTYRRELKPSGLSFNDDSTPSQPPPARGRGLLPQGGLRGVESPPTSNPRSLSSRLWTVTRVSGQSEPPGYSPGLNKKPAENFSHCRQRDVGALFLGSIFITALLTLVLVIAPHWQRARYLLMQIQGIFLLLGAHGCREIILWLPWPRRQVLRQVSGAAILALVVSVPFLLSLKPFIEAGNTGWNRYDQAFGYVQDNLADGDKVMSMHPPAGLLYLNQSDYYLVQSSPKLIVRPDGALGDRYSGAIWLQTVNEFNDLLLGPDKIWLVTQEFWLFNSYDGYLQQQILWQMDKLWGEGGVWALSGRSGTWPLAQEVDTALNAEFYNGTRLLGFRANPPTPARGDVVQLTLFWQNVIPHGAKVFVHMRDTNNNTVIQADHFIYDGKVPTSRWPALLKNDTVIRDGATLVIPPDLESGTYRVVTGFYHPETFERLGVVNDQSGENAVILSEWDIE